MEKFKDTSKNDVIRKYGLALAAKNAKTDLWASGSGIIIAPKIGITAKHVLTTLEQGFGINFQKKR